MKYELEIPVQLRFSILKAEPSVGVGPEIEDLEVLITSPEGKTIDILDYLSNDEIENIEQQILNEEHNNDQQNNTGRKKFKLTAYYFHKK